MYALIRNHHENAQAISSRAAYLGEKNGAPVNTSLTEFFAVKRLTAFGN
jgi:hypothetical protein